MKVIVNSKILDFYLVKNGYTTGNLCEKAKISRQTFSRLRATGKATPPVAFKISKALGIPLKDFLVGSENK